MGLYHNTYFGPFLIVKDSEKEFTETIYQTESGKIHKKHSNFDSETGEPIYIKENKVLKKVKGIDNKFLDNLCSDTFVDIESAECEKDETIYILNKKFNNKFVLDENQTLKIANVFNVNDSVTEFYNLYSKELVELTKEGYNYGIFWGIVNYQS